MILSVFVAGGPIAFYSSLVLDVKMAVSHRLQCDTLLSAKLSLYYLISMALVGTAVIAKPSINVRLHVTIRTLVKTTASVMWGFLCPYGSISRLLFSVGSCMVVIVVQFQRTKIGNR